MKLKYPVCKRAGRVFFCLFVYFLPFVDKKRTFVDRHLRGQTILRIFVLSIRRNAIKTKQDDNANQSNRR